MAQKIILILTAFFPVWIIVTNVNDLGSWVIALLLFLILWLPSAAAWSLSHDPTSRIPGGPTGKLPWQ